MRRLLSLVMAKNIGQVMTLELAKAMARELMGVAENPIDVTRFAPQKYKGYVIACERLEDIQAEIHPLHERHWAETETNNSIPLNGDYEQVIERERAGQLLQFTARVKKTNELVGNMRVYLGTSLHTQTLFCEEDTFYLAPEHRGGFLAVRLWQFVEKAVVSLGVKEIHFDSKLVNKADKMALYLKYTPVATKFTKTFA